MRRDSVTPIDAPLPLRALALVLAALALASACAGKEVAPPPAPPGAIAAGQSIGTAAITGRVTFEGPAPERRAIRVTTEAACHRPGTELLAEDLIVGAGGALRNVYVHVVSGLGDRVFAAPVEPAVMNQEGCRFDPHVVDVQAGQIVEFGNDDPIVHNVRAAADGDASFNVSMPGNGKKKVRRFFTAPGVVRIRCDIHAWMSGYIPVESHPFHRVTGDDGTFALRGLPAGTYTVEAWHEKLGRRTLTATVADGATATLDFKFAPGGAP